MAKKKTLPTKAPHNVVTLVESNDPAKIAKGMAEHVDGWEEMSDRVKQQVIDLSIMVLGLHNPPIMSVEDCGIEVNAENPQLHTLRLMRTFASSSGDFINYMLGRLATVLKGSGGLTKVSLNAALAFIDGLNPKTEMEATLALQMFITNDAATRAMRQMNSAEWADSIHQFGNLSIKLMRTFTLQAEAMAKLQRGGVQTVKHVHVDNRGGQAVIAETVHTGGQNGKVEEQSLARFAGSPAMLGQDTPGNGVPITLCPRQEAVPHARGN